MSEEPVESFLLFDLADCDYRNMTIFYFIARFTPYICPIYLPSHCVLLFILCIKYSYSFQ